MCYIEFRYIVVAYNANLNTIRAGDIKCFVQILNSLKTPYTSLLWASYGESFLSSLAKSYREISRGHCIYKIKLYQVHWDRLSDTKQLILVWNRCSYPYWLFRKVGHSIILIRSIWTTIVVNLFHWMLNNNKHIHSGIIQLHKCSNVIIYYNFFVVALFTPFIALYVFQELLIEFWLPMHFKLYKPFCF